MLGTRWETRARRGRQRVRVSRAAVDYLWRMAEKVVPLLTVVLASVGIAGGLRLGPMAHLSEGAAVLTAFGASCGAVLPWWPVVAVVAAAAAVLLMTLLPLGLVGTWPWASDALVAEMTVGTIVVFVVTSTVVVVGRYVSAGRDAAQRAEHDPLTGLLNRTALETRLGRWIEHGKRAGCAGMFAVLFIDLDRFHAINATHGHDVGDHLLRAVGRLLQEHVRQGDLVARLGGDEFLVAMPGLRDRITAASVAEKLIGILADPIVVDGRLVSVSASIGIAVYPTDGASAAELLTCADNAMDLVKSGGKNSFVFADTGLRERHVRRVDIERRLAFAVSDQRLRLVYQPQIDLTSGRVMAFEALLRWDDDMLGTVSPAEFIPIAEESGQILSIGTWVLREACHQASVWAREAAPGIPVAVNVSAVQFRNHGFLQLVKDALKDSHLDPSLLEIEVTESVLIDEHNVATPTLHRLQRLGVTTALDDFGTGYSSLAYLQRLPIGTIKIDRDFVMSLKPSTRTGQVSSVPIIEAIAAMGRALDKIVVAEGVESAVQGEYLARLGVDRAQGYHFGRPMGAAETVRIVETQRAADMAQTGAARARPTGEAYPRSPLPLMADGGGMAAPELAAANGRANLTVTNALIELILD